MQKKYLQDVYSKSDETPIDAFYDDWADSYEDELADNAYATPQRLAGALAKTETPNDARVIDYGCGTGLCGVALVAQGFTLIDGTDVSEQMLARAESKQIYGRLWRAEDDPAVPVALGAYDVIVAAGVVSPGAAPASLLAKLAACLNPGGRLAFSFNDHALHDEAYLTALRALPNDDGMQLLFEEYGAHLPGIDLKSTIYVFEKA